MIIACILHHKAFDFVEFTFFESDPVTSVLRLVRGTGLKEVVPPLSGSHTVGDKLAEDRLDEV